VRRVIRIVLACVLYLAVVMAWAVERLDDGSAPSLTVRWGIAVVAVHVLAGMLVPRWRILLLPFAAVLLAVPLGYPKHGEVPVALVLLYWAPVALLLVATGVALVRYLPPLLRTRAISG
jgi:hypothetical protein